MFVCLVTQKMMLFLSQHQRKLDEYIADAEEWAAAKENAQLEALTDWALLCKKGEEAC